MYKITIYDLNCKYICYILQFFQGSPETTVWKEGEKILDKFKITFLIINSAGKSRSKVIPTLFLMSSTCVCCQEIFSLGKISQENKGQTKVDGFKICNLFFIFSLCTESFPYSEFENFF